MIIEAVEDIGPRDFRFVMGGQVVNMTLKTGSRLDFDASTWHDWVGKPTAELRVGEVVNGWRVVALSVGDFPKETPAP